MQTIIRKEWVQFFSGWMGLITIAVYLLASGMLLFFYPEQNLFDAGYASLDSFFDFSPMLLLILVPAVTMRSFSDEYSMGTFELLQSLPIRHSSFVLGKFLSVVCICLIALMGTFIYVWTLQYFSLNGLDMGGILGSYVGLLLLILGYASIGIYISSMLSNALTSFMLTAFCCFIFYYFFSFFPEMYIANHNIGYYISLIGMKYHYENISKGYVSMSDLVYFLSVAGLFIYQTIVHLSIRNK